MTKEEAEFRVRLKKKRNHDVIKSFVCTIVGVLLISSVIAYFATPISKSKKIYVKGNKYLTKENITIYEMKKQDVTLEDAFIELIEGGKF